MGVRCVDCWKLGYQYEIKREHSVPGGIISDYNPESLPPQLREALSRRSAERVDYGLKSLPSINEQMGCLERIVVEQQESLWEPRYVRGETESQSDYMKRVIDLAMNERTCAHFSQYIGGLTVADQVEFQRKVELDNKVVYLKQRILLETLRRLHGQFLGFDALSHQERGYKFQHLLKDLFQAYELNPIESVVIPGEQIDLVLTIKPLDTVLVEAKWESTPVGPSKVSHFYVKLEERSPRVIGLFVSMSGFTKGAEKVVRNSRQKTLYHNNGPSRHGVNNQRPSQLHHFARGKGKKGGGTWVFVVNRPGVLVLHQYLA